MPSTLLRIRVSIFMKKLRAKRSCDSESEEGGEGAQLWRAIMQSENHRKLLKTEEAETKRFLVRGLKTSYNFILGRNGRAARNRFFDLQRSPRRVREAWNKSATWQDRYLNASPEAQKMVRPDVRNAKKVSGSAYRKDSDCYYCDRFLSVSRDCSRLGDRA